MDIRTSLANARISRIAIVDDDLSNLISTTDLSRVDADIEALMADVHDPDRQAYIQCLREHGYTPNDLTDLAHPLSDQTVRDAAPERLRSAAERVLEARQGNAEPVQRIIDLLIASGIDRANIDIYSSPLVPIEKRYDLLILDYYLVNDSIEQTIPFIEHMRHQHAQEDHPLQIILMSSHEEGLKADFRELRPKAKVSSARMRILAKPREEIQLAAWKLTLEQLSTDRQHVLPFESFVNKAIGAMNSATAEQSRKLWGLDLQAMKLLYDAAKADNDDFSRYMEECLSRYFLTRLEEIQDLRDELESLRQQFDQNGTTVPVSAGAEIGDSRAAVREVMTSMAWRGGVTPELSRRPRLKKQRPDWIRRTLRFGMVLRDPNGRLWLNLTQSCDLAQAKPDELPDLSLLLVSGSTSSPVTEENKSRKMVRMSAPMMGSGQDLITWNLQRISTPSVQQFANELGAGWTIAGELRLDQAQNVVVNYGAQATRVALQHSVSSWTIKGIALTAGALKDAEGKSPPQGINITGQALPHKKQHLLHFELATYSTLQNNFPGSIGDDSLRLCSGVGVSPGNVSQGEPYIVYCASAPADVDILRGQVKDKQLLERDQNANKVIVAVWPA